MPERVQEAFRGIREDFFHITDELFHIRTRSFSIDGARGDNDGKGQETVHMTDMAFRQIDQGPDDRNARTAHFCFRMKCMEAAFVY